jgi:hypothetical protein
MTTHGKFSASIRNPYIAAYRLQSGKEKLLAEGSSTPWKGIHLTPPKKTR